MFSNESANLTIFYFTSERIDGRKLMSKYLTLSSSYSINFICKSILVEKRKHLKIGKCHDVC